MGRKLFCEISPLTYQISVNRCRVQRQLTDLFARRRFAVQTSYLPLPIVVYRHNSLIRRTLGEVDMQLQENKAVNLFLAAPRVSHILIRPGEIFSFWRLVGEVTARKGYLPGLTISNGRVGSDIGGGLCQLTNLIHWMVLHTPLTIVEHHHHNGLDLFPDHGRQIPFGTGTSVFYNYIDYRFRNDTPHTYQLIVYTTKTHLCGELRANRQQLQKYHVEMVNERFVREENDVYRCGEVWRKTIERHSGDCTAHELLYVNHAKVVYDCANLLIEESIK